MNLLKEKGVQKDLNLSEEQVKKVDELFKHQAELMKDPAKLKDFASNAKKSIDELLTVDQKKRMAELTLQAQGIIALMADKKVAKEMNLTVEQLQNISRTLAETLLKV
jgi:hypothetical protein